jgi:hypothetical protein
MWVALYADSAPLPSNRSSPSAQVGLLPCYSLVEPFLQRDKRRASPQFLGTTNLVPGQRACSAPSTAR